MIRVSAVIVQMTMVSTKISPHAHALWRTGWSVLAGACQDDAEPGAGVVGIHPAREAVADRVADGGARKAADAGDRGKGVGEDRAEGRGDPVLENDQDADAGDDIEARP